MKDPALIAPAGVTTIHVDTELLSESPPGTQSIDIDALFTKDLSESGSFNFRGIRRASFGKLLEALPIPALLIDESHVIRFANEALAKILPDSADLVGTRFSSLFPQPTDSEKVADYLRGIFLRRKTRLFEGMIRFGGQVLWCRVNLRTMRFRSHRSVLALVEDLTSEKRQLILNEKYHQLVQVFPIGIAEFGLADPIPATASTELLVSGLLDSKLIGGNAEFARIHGVGSIEDMPGRRLRDILPLGGFRERFLSAWIDRGFPIRTFETVEREDIRQRRYFENTLVGNVKAGHLFGLWVMRQNITARKESEQALRSSRDKLEERVRERTIELERMNEQLKQEIIERKKAQTEQGKLVMELQAALSKVKTLSGLLPICASCKKIRDDGGDWTQMEVYVRRHSHADFTHSICPDCATKLYPGFYNKTP